MTKKKRSSFRDKVNRSVQRDKQRSSSYGYLNLPKNVNVLKIEDAARIHLDFMPYLVTDEAHPDRDDEYGVATPGDLWYRRPFKTHRGIGPNNETVVCPTSFGKKCPICDYRAKRLKEGADKDETDALKLSYRNLYVVIPVGHKKMEETMHIWDISNYVFQNKLDDELNEDEDRAVFPDLEEGLTLSIRFTEETFAKNKWYDVSRIDFKERDEAYDESILEDVPNLDELLTVQSYEALERLFLDLEEAEDLEDEEEADDDEPVAPPQRKKKKTKPAPEPEDEDDEDEDEDEEEEPAPAKKRTKKTGSKTTGNKCPYGHKFGEDCEKFDDCDECELWDECIEAQEKE